MRPSCSTPSRPRSPRAPRARLALAHVRLPRGPRPTPPLAPHAGHDALTACLRPTRSGSPERAARTLPRRRPRARLRHRRRPGREHHPGARRLRVQRVRALDGGGASSECAPSWSGARGAAAMASDVRESSIRSRRGYRDTRQRTCPWRERLGDAPRRVSAESPRGPRPARRSRQHGHGRRLSRGPFDSPVSRDRRRRGPALCHEHRFAQAAAATAGQIAPLTSPRRPLAQDTPSSLLSDPDATGRRSSRVSGETR